MLEATLDAGAEDVDDLDEAFGVQSEATDVVAVRTALQDAGIDYDSADVQFVASLEIPVDADGAGKVMRLVDALEDLDDVQDVFTNVDVPADVHGRARGRRRLTGRRTSRRRPRVVRRPHLMRVSVAGRTGVRTIRLVKGVDVRVLGIDPGLTRCGVGVVDGSVGRPCRWSTSA